MKYLIFKDIFAWQYYTKNLKEASFKSAGIIHEGNKYPSLKALSTFLSTKAA